MGFLFSQTVKTVLLENVLISIPHDKSWGCSKIHYDSTHNLEYSYLKNPMINHGAVLKISL